MNPTTPAGRGRFAGENAKPSTKKKLEKANEGDLEAALSLGWGIPRLTRMYNSKQNRDLWLPIDDEQLLAKIEARQAKNRKNAGAYGDRVKAQKQAAAVQPPATQGVPKDRDDYFNASLRAQAQARVEQIEAEAEAEIDKIEENARAATMRIDEENDRLFAWYENDEVTEALADQIGLKSQTTLGVIIKDSQCLIEAVEKDRDTKINQIEANYFKALDNAQGQADEGGGIGNNRNAAGPGDDGDGENQEDSNED